MYVCTQYSTYPPTIIITCKCNLRSSCQRGVHRTQLLPRIHPGPNTTHKKSHHFSPRRDERLPLLQDSPWPPCYAIEISTVQRSPVHCPRSSVGRPGQASAGSRARGTLDRTPLFESGLGQWLHHIDRRHRSPSSGVRSVVCSGHANMHTVGIYIPEVYYVHHISPGGPLPPS